MIVCPHNFIIKSIHIIYCLIIISTYKVISIMNLLESAAEFIISQQEYNEYHKLKHDVIELQTKLEAATIRGEQLAKSNDHLHLQLVKFQEETAQLKDNTKELSRLSLKKMKEGMKLEEKLRHELDVQNQTVAYLNQERSRLQKKVEEVEQESIQYSMKNSELQEALQQQKTALNQREQQSQSLRKELSQAKQKQESYQAKLRELIGRSKILQQQKEKIQQQFLSNKQRLKNDLISIRDSLRYNSGDYPISEQVKVNMQSSMLNNSDITKTEPDNVIRNQIFGQISSIHSKKSAQINQLQNQNYQLKQKISKLQLQIKSFEEKLQKPNEIKQEPRVELKKKFSSTNDHIEQSNSSSNSSILDQSIIAENSRLLDSVKHLQGQNSGLRFKYSNRTEACKQLKAQNDNLKEQLRRLREIHQVNNPTPNS